VQDGEFSEPSRVVIELRICRWILTLLLILLSSYGVYAIPSSGILIAPEGITGTGLWIERPESGRYCDWSPAMLSWSIGLRSDGLWSYHYEFKVYRAAVSHFILQTSPNLRASEIIDPSGSFKSLEIGTYSPGRNGQSNPYLPAEIYGIKFDDAYGTSLTIDFCSLRPPIWGSFFAEAGPVGGEWNTAWNLGLTDSMATDKVPTALWIPVPDTHPTCPAVPEPAGMVGFGMLVLAVWTFRRRT